MTHQRPSGRQPEGVVPRNLPPWRGWLPEKTRQFNRSVREVDWAQGHGRGNARGGAEATVGPLLVSSIAGHALLADTNDAGPHSGWTRPTLALGAMCAWARSVRQLPPSDHPCHIDRSPDDVQVPCYCSLVRQTTMNPHIKFVIVAVLAASAYHPTKAEPSSVCGVAEDICQSSQFKAYTACVDAAIIYWDPKGPTLAPKNFPPARSVLAVLMECEYAAKDFGKRFGNHLANILQQTANERVAAARYGPYPCAHVRCLPRIRSKT